LAIDQPTSSELARPGPRVAATASMALQGTPEAATASSTMPGSSSMWQREAISGTTPP